VILYSLTYRHNIILLLIHSPGTPIYIRNNIVNKMYGFNIMCIGQRFSTGGGFRVCSGSGEYGNDGITKIIMLFYNV